MIEESHEDRAADPQTVAAIKESFNGLLDQNKPVMENKVAISSDLV